MRMLVALLLVIAAGVGALYQGTDGFQAVTTESARRLAIARAARLLPVATLQFESGRKITLAQTLKQDGRITIVNFFYTRCNAICSVMGTEFQQLQQTLQASGMRHKVRLLSISFDPSDDPAQLASYARQMHAQPEVWQFAGVPDPVQRRTLLDTFGITVIPAPLNEFQHNAAFHIVTADGMLSKIVDYDAPAAALEWAGLAAAQGQKAGPAGVGAADSAAGSITDSATTSGRRS